MNDDPPPETIGVVPTSLGALLAEEWTVNPYSTLPSFLEMIWIHEADDSMAAALESGLDQATATLDRQLWLLQQMPLPLLEHNNSSSNDDDNDTLWNRSTANLKRRFHSLQRHVLIACQKLMKHYKPEIVALVWYVAERESLRRSQACLSESMYGGHRVKMTHHHDDDPNRSVTTRKLEPLQTTDLTRMALLKAMVPYLHQKLERLVQRIRNSLPHATDTDDDSSTPPPSLYHHPSLVLASKRWLVFLYPFLRASVQGMNLLCHWKFLTGQSLSFDLSSLLLNQVVRRVTLQDRPSAPELPDSPAKTNGTTTKISSSTPSSIASPESLSSLRGTLLWGTSFAVMVSWATWIKAEWDRVYREQQTSLSSSSPNQFGPIPPPPPPPPPIWNRGPHHPKRQRIQHGACPLCRAKPPVLATACVVSGGLVYCHDCISRHVALHKACPVTGSPCSKEHLVRLYEPRFHPNRARST